ncbi:hypothetical protein Q4Q40_05740 [Flavivirga jejuensis]|uniref:Transposase n=1 Tax=Flavivirga jejuensis TaxID=870487 RepID=A0ABT8WKJ4_9FLAO|nr:hypothetical protein [Flavivirga jejuensis]MDO5973679.1 hypothetical protein [Flavivirga jejuensis]
MLRNKITEFFVKLDDFYKEFTSQLEYRPELQYSKVKRRHRKGKLSDSEIMSIYWSQMELKLCTLVHVAFSF